MRVLYLGIIITLLSIGCVSSTFEENRLVGKWNFLIANGYQCYMCPEIEFEDNGSGNFIPLTTKKIKFNFKTLPKNKIEFVFNDTISQSFFKKSDIFYYEIQTVEDHQYFDLLDLKTKKVIHTLIRQAPSNGYKE